MYALAMKTEQKIKSKSNFTHIHNKMVPLSYSGNLESSAVLRLAIVPPDRWYQIAGRWDWMGKQRYRGYQRLRIDA